MLIQLVPALLLMFLFLGCENARMTEVGGNEEQAEKTGLQSCTITAVVDTEFAARIECPDGSSLNVPKTKHGVDGVSGTSCSVKASDQGAMIQCEDGSQAFVKNGSDGHSCQVQTLDRYSSLIECSDGSQSLIDLNSLTHFQIEKIVAPCDDDPDHLDEVLLLFANGDVLAYFEQGGKRFLTKLGPGRYRTTDKQKCLFEISEEGQISEL